MIKIYRWTTGDSPPRFLSSTDAGEIKVSFIMRMSTVGEYKIARKQLDQALEILGRKLKKDILRDLAAERLSR